MVRVCLQFLFVLLIFAASTAFADVVLPPPETTVPPIITSPINETPKDPSVNFHQERFLGEYSNSTLPPPGETPAQIAAIPQPGGTFRMSKYLTLQDAIYLALRTNPQVKINELDRINNKYALELAYREFVPQYTFNLTDTYATGAKPSYLLTNGITILSPIGTVYSVQNQNNLTSPNTNSTTLSITQPLLKGFNIPILTYYDAIDQEALAKLTFETNAIAVVNAVISTFRSLVSGFNQLEAERRSVEEQEEQLQQYALQYKVGKLSRADYLQSQGTIESTKLTYVQEQNAVQQSYQAFLAALGLIPTANLMIDKRIDFINFKVPQQDEAIAILMANNIQLQTDILNISIARRNIIRGENERRWELDVTATQNIVTNVNSGIPVTSTTTVTTPSGAVIPVTTAAGNGASLASGRSLQLSLTVPIDDVKSKADLIADRIAYESAKLTYQQDKANIIGTLISQLNTIKLDRQQIVLAQNTVNLQQLTLNATLLRKTYGKATMFEVTQNQTILLQDQLTLISQEITLQNDITQLSTILGTTLKDWDIALRY